MMSFPKKMLNDASPILVALLMWTLSFKAGPLLVFAAGTQPTQHVPTPPGHHHNPLLVLADLPIPSHHRNVHYTIEASAAVELSTCPPVAPQCPKHAPTPGCCTAKSKEEEQVKANGKAQLLVLADPKPIPHLPNPSHQRNVHSSVGVSAAGELSMCSPAAPQCPQNAPTPGCCTANSKEANGKA